MQEKNDERLRGISGMDEDTWNTTTRRQRDELNRRGIKASRKAFVAGRNTTQAFEKTVQNEARKLQK